MGRWILGRLLNTAFVVVGLSTLVFFVLRVIPGDPVTLLLPPDAPQQAVQALRTSLGLDQPLHVQYFRFLLGIAQGDLGVSYRLKLPATTLLAERFPSTLQLAVASMGLALLLAMPLGILAAKRSGSWLDAGAQNLALISQSVPSFWLGLIFIQLFAVRWKVLPAISGSSPRGLVLPVVTLALVLFPVLFKTTHSEFRKVLEEDYLRTAEALGLPPGRILRYALRGILVPLVTVIGIQFGYVLGGAFIIEYVFARAGIGSLAIEAVAARDFPLVQTVVIFTSTVFLLVNLVVDILYGFLDPRIRYQAERGPS